MLGRNSNTRCPFLDFDVADNPHIDGLCPEIIALCRMELQKKRNFPLSRQVEMASIASTPTQKKPTKHAVFS